MRHIALVQNQSEMANYSHADGRAIFAELGYSYSLFTANSIKALPDQLASRKFECLVLASNALHDKVIRQFFESDNGRLSVNEFQRSGGGIVIFMQYKAAYETYSFDFVLPDAVAPTAKQRAKIETALTSSFAAVSRPSAPPILTYPNKVDLELLQRLSLDHPTLPGAYWHWWDVDLASSWDAHLICSVSGEPRPLIVTAKEHLGIRAIMSAVPADWQGHKALLDNVLLYGCEGRHHAAAITTGISTDTSIKYLVAKLRARNIGLRHYILDRTITESLYRNIVEGVHNTLILEPSIDLGGIFSSEQVSLIREKIERGEIRTVTFAVGTTSWQTSVQVCGRRNPAQDAYQFLIPRISNELLRGYLDGSFRSTLSGLQDLEGLPYGLDAGVFPLRPALEEAEKHDRNGSYDEVIGATAGFLWLRARVLGLDDAKTQSTARWLRARLSRVDDRERIYALCVLEEIGLATEEERQLAKSTLGALTPLNSSELELLAFLTGAVRFGHEQTALAVISEFSRRSQVGGGPLWVDTPTTANLVRLLIDAHARFASLSAAGSSAGVVLRDLVIPSMIVLEADYERSLVRPLEAVYPWDGKASTALRCLSAWYRFERYSRAPVEEAAGAVVRASQGATLSTLAGGALASLKTLFNEYEKLKTSLAEQTTQVAKLIDAERSLAALTLRCSRAVRNAALLAIALFAVGYVFIDHVVRKYVFKQNLVEVGHSLFENWGQHMAVLGLGAAYLAVPWPTIWKWFTDFIERRRASHE